MPRLRRRRYCSDSNGSASHRTYKRESIAKASKVKLNRIMLTTPRTEGDSMYSQLGQDVWVLDQCGSKRGGVFIEIGAHDGIELSNTLLMEQEYGWTGLCVEANAGSYSDLVCNRACQCLHAAAWNESGKRVRFHRSAVDPMFSSVAVLGSNEVETVSLNDLCEMVGGVVDYISIDTEGSEPRILSTFDLDRYTVKCMSVEHNYVERNAQWLRAWFADNGYEMEWRKWDVLAVRPGA
jgi:FkbM family methyltransferase